jgi:hypothetical protein
MSTLHDTLTEYLSTQEGSPKLKKLAIEQLENRITQEIVEQEATKIENKALELQRERTEKERYEKINQRIKDAERTFLVVVVLGLMIGLAGNQITEIISSIKEQFEVNRTILTLIFTAVIAYGVYLIFKRQYISTATDLINDFFRKGHEEQ